MKCSGFALSYLRDLNILEEATSSQVIRTF